MAQLRRVIRSNPISNFDQKGPQGGAAFAVLADAAQTLYERMAPAAMEKMKATGAEEGRRLAQQQAGGQRVRVSSMGGGSGNFRDAIASIESAGSGDYAAVGPVTSKGNRAYGRYQVMDFNIGPWTEKYVGRRMTPEEFLADPAAQDAVFDGEFGSYVERFGNPQDAASMWFSGRPISQAGNASDGYTTVPEYIAKFNAALGASQVMSTKSPDTTMVRTSEGKLEPRLYSPYAGEILQAHNIAAGIAYQSEMLNSGLVDLLSISQEFPLNPEGFEQAAREYVDSVVENAPEAFKADLRGSLEKEAQRRFLGMVDEKHRDIRQRADNSSRALMDRWSTNYAEALASGNDDEAQAALAELQSVLRAREALPGAAWTPEQSANVVMDAQRAAQGLVESQTGAIRTDLRDRLRTITKAAKDGLSAADEAILADPLTQTLLPEEWAEAQAFVTLRDQMPEFHRMTPAQQQEAIAEMRANPIQMDFEVDLLGAAEAAAADNARLWEEDPIAHANEVLQEKPPTLPDFGPETAEQFVAALAARGEYARGLMQDGYVDFFSVLTDQEAQSFGAVFSKESPPEARAAFAGALVAGLGRDAIRVFDELKVDPVTRYAGKIMAVGGDATLAREAMVGQQLIAEGLVQLPAKSTSLAAFSPEIMEALSGLPNPVGAQAEIMPFAQALYAARGQGVQPDSEGGFPTLLPLGMTAAQFTESLGVPSTGTFNRLFGSNSLDLTRWQEATGSVPHWGGRPVTADMFADGRVRYVAVGQSLYRMEIVSGSSVTDIVDENGDVLMFDPMRLREAAQ